MDRIMSTSIILLDQNFSANDVDIMVFEPSVLFPPHRRSLGGIDDMVQILIHFTEKTKKFWRNKKVQIGQIEKTFRGGYHFMTSRTTMPSKFKFRFQRFITQFRVSNNSLYWSWNVLYKVEKSPRNNLPKMLQRKPLCELQYIWYFLGPECTVLFLWWYCITNQSITL